MNKQELENYNLMLSTLSRVYVDLQVAATLRVSTAIDTDSIRAMLRNTLASVTDTESKTVQEECEQAAFERIYKD